MLTSAVYKHTKNKRYQMMANVKWSDRLNLIHYGSYKTKKEANEAKVIFDAMYAAGFDLPEIDKALKIKRRNGGYSLRDL